MVGQGILFEYKTKFNYNVSDDNSTFVGWSYSRRNLFENCLLQYYYNYYGASKKIARNELLEDHLHFLKSLKNIKLRVGEIVHLVIRSHLKKLKQYPTTPAFGLAQWGQKIFRNDLEFSNEFLKDKSLRPKNREILLSEFYHNIPNAEDLWEEANISLKTALDNFIGSPRIQDFRLGAIEPKSIIEEKLNLKIGKKRVSGQIDLAFEDSSQRTKIIDWKTGMPNNSDDSLQLFSYALLMSEKYGISPDDIDIYKIYLESEEIVSSTVNKNEIMRAKGRILQDIDRMNSMDSYGKNAVSKVFTPCDQPLICQMCPFRTICPSNKEDYRND